MEAHERRALPEGWQIKKIKDFAEVITGGTPSTIMEEYWTDGTIPWLPSGDLKNCKIIEAHKFITKLGLDNSAAKVMPKKTVLIALTGATTGQIGLMEIEASANQSVTGILPSNEHFPEYLFYYLQTLRKKIIDLSYGGAQPHISQGFVKNIDIILPPLVVQKKIAAILEKAEETKKLRAQADELTDRLLQSIFLEMFGDSVKNPKGWEMIKLGELAEISSGSTPSRDVPSYFGGEIPWVKTTEVKGIRIHDTEEYITMDGLNNSSCKIYPKKSLIIAMYGQGKTRGNVGLLEIDATTNQACCVLKPNQKYDSVYLFELLRNSYDNLRNLGRGGNQPNLNGEIIKNYVIPLPPLPLQQKFARVVEKIEAMRQSQNQSKHQIEDLFSALMQKAFRGEI